MTPPSFARLLAPLLFVGLVGSPALAANGALPGATSPSTPSKLSTPPSTPRPVPPPSVRQVRPVVPNAGRKPAFGAQEVDIAAAFFPVGARVSHQTGNVVRTLEVGEDRRSYDVAPPHTIVAPRNAPAAAPAAAPPSRGVMKGLWASANARWKGAFGKGAPPPSRRAEMTPQHPAAPERR